MTKQNKKIKYTNPKLIQEVSTTGDTKTNDFDLTSNKKPASSTIRTQIRKAQALIELGYTIPTRTEFDRLRIGVNLSLYGTQIEFKDVYLEEVANPKEPPSYIAENNKKWDLCNALKELDNISNKDKEFDDDDNCIDNEIEDILFDEYLDENTTQTIIYEDNSNPYTTLKNRIYYDDYSRTIGLTNLFIDNGYFVVDISGKFMHGPGELGNLNKDNIREALQKIIDLKVVSFNIEKFIQHAQVFVCDILQFAVDGQHQILAVHRFAYRPDIFHDMTETVLDDTAAAIDPRQHTLRSQLDTFLTGILDIRETDDVSHHFAFGIETLVLFPRLDACDSEFDDFIGHFIVHLTFQVNETAVGIQSGVQ